MSDPAFLVCTKDAWVKVATNVNTGVLWRRNRKPTEYLFSYRATGNPAPTKKNEGVPIFRNEESDYEKIDGSAIDIYIWAVGAAGKVRVDA